MEEWGRTVTTAAGGTNSVTCAVRRIQSESESESAPNKIFMPHRSHTEATPKPHRSRAHALSVSRIHPSVCVQTVHTLTLSAHCCHCAWHAPMHHVWAKALLLHGVCVVHVAKRERTQSAVRRHDTVALHADVRELVRCSYRRVKCSK